MSDAPNSSPSVDNPLGSSPVAVPTPAEAAKITATPATPTVSEEATKAALAAVKADTKPATPASSKKKYKLQVNKQEREIEFDPSNDEEVKNWLQKGLGSEQKFQEAAELRKAAMEFIEELKKNPRAVLTNPNIGVDVKKFAEQILNDELKEMDKTPEQKEKEKLTKELEDLKKQAKDREEAVKQSDFQRLQLEHERSLEAGIAAALDIGGLPKTPRTVKAMADYMMIALQNGIDLSPQEIAPIVKDMTQREFKELVQSLPDDQLEDFLGKEVLSRLRKKNVAKAKAIDTSNAIKSTGKTDTATSKEPAKKMTMKEFFGI